MATRPSNYGQPWTRKELVLAFDLYCRIPFKATKATNPAVQQLARLLHRSPAGVARKLGNFGAFDPRLRERNIVGLTHGSALDRQVWDEFHSDWPSLIDEAAQIAVRLGAPAQSTTTEDAFESPSGPSESLVLAKRRNHQAFFRQAILSSYEFACCITGLAVPEALVASHIVAWSRNENLRVAPTNGLCLSSTFDRLFDAGLIMIDESMSTRFAEALLKRLDPKRDKCVYAFNGQRIRLPARFLPDPACLRWHGENVFRK
jgi:putative restriction endonuclease